MNWWLPPQGSTFAGPIDSLFLAILIITGIAFVLVEAGILWFSIKYRSRPGRKATFVHGSTKAEVIWTAIPAVTVIALGVVSQRSWLMIKGRDSVPAEAYPIAIHAKQFEWNVTYPGPDGELGTGDDFTARNRLDVPLDRPTNVKLHAEDVIHSFFIPLMRLKQDAVPGMETHEWFQPTRAGEFPIGCAELCGIGHTRMRGTLTVHTPEDYQTWMNSQLQAAQPAPDTTAQPAAQPAR